MLIASKDVKVQTSGMKATTAFRANLDGMMFDNLINGIYSNKVGAGIREYATNARDGHARKGNLDKPFDVGLPNRDKAFFEVRDYGSSLTHEEVFNIFAVLGESTKRDTNDETGCLGLGSKSAFAYTNAFSVTCWKNDTKRDYSCYIGEDGKPLVSLISEIKSREPEGVRVSYAVKQSDIEDFNKEASVQLRGFKPQPNIIRSTNSYRPIDETNLMLKGNGWKIYKPADTGSNSYYNTRGKPMAVQGAVAYPIDYNNASLSTAIREQSPEDYDKIRKMLSATDILIDFDIGQLRMTTSREELAYDEMTCKNLAEKLDKVLQDIQDVLDKEYADFKTMKEAQLFRSENQNTAITEIEKLLNIRKRWWKGELIRVNMPIAEADDHIGVLKEDYLNRPDYYNKTPKNEFLNSVKGEMRVINEYNFRNKFGEIKAQFQWPLKTNQNSAWDISIKAHLVKDIVVLIEIENLIEGNKNSLMRRFWKDRLKPTNDRFLWIKVDSIHDAEKFLEYIYHDDRSNQVYLHKLSELKMPKKGSQGTNAMSKNTANVLERRFRFIVGTQYTWSGDRATYELVDLSTRKEKLPVVFFKNSKFYTTEKEYSDPDSIQWDTLENVQRYIWSWAPNEKIYVINGQQKKFYEDNKQYFQEVTPHLKDTWLKTNQGWEKKYAETTYQDNGVENRNLGKQFKMLAKKYGINFKSLETALKQDWDDLDTYQSPSRYLNNMPVNYETVLKDELVAAVKNNPQPQQKHHYVKLAKDPVIHYLISELPSYSPREGQLNAIRHYKKLINE